MEKILLILIDILLMPILAQSTTSIKTVSSISELILSVIQTLGIEIDRDIATNLYAGAAASTNNFTSYSTNADTFEHIAALLRSGAVKKAFKNQFLLLLHHQQNFQSPQPQ